MLEQSEKTWAECVPTVRDWNTSELVKEESANLRSSFRCKEPGHELPPENERKLWGKGCKRGKGRGGGRNRGNNHVDAVTKEEAEIAVVV